MHPLPLLLVPLKYQPNNHNIYTQDMGQSHMLVAPASVNSGLLTQWTMFSWCAPASPTPAFFPPSLPQGFPFSGWRQGPGGDLQFRLSFYLMSGCGPLHLLPSAAQESLSDDDVTRLRSVSVTEYH